MSVRVKQVYLRDFWKIGVMVFISRSPLLALRQSVTGDTLDDIIFAAAAGSALIAGCLLPLLLQSRRHPLAGSPDSRPFRAGCIAERRRCYHDQNLEHHSLGATGASHSTKKRGSYSHPIACRTLGLYNLRPELPRTRKSSDVECLLLAGDSDIYPCISILWMGNSTPLVQKAYCSSHRSTRTPCNTRAIRVGHLYTAMWCTSLSYPQPVIEQRWDWKPQIGPIGPPVRHCPIPFGQVLRLKCFAKDDRRVRSDQVTPVLEGGD